MERSPVLFHRKRRMLRIRGLLSAVALATAAHTPPTGLVWGFVGVVSLSCPQTGQKSPHRSKFGFSPQNELTPPPKGGGAGYRLSWGRRVCLTRLQPAHTAPTGPVWGIAGVVSLRSFQNRTQGHTGPSLGSPFFLEAFLLRQGCQILLQLVIHRLLDGADRVKKIPISFAPSLPLFLPS